MPVVQCTLTGQSFGSPRTEQVAALFNLPPAARITRDIVVELPPVDGSWRVGLVLGPSTSGKTTVVRQWLGGRLARPGRWPAHRAILDGFGALSVERTVRLLTAVGLGSPPSWLRPYCTLSGGERFRCDLARALARTRDDAVCGFDEFTSVVDRDVARAVSAAVAKAVRQRQVGCRFVAVTCHADVARWLAPDWVLDMTDRTLHWRSLRRPAIALELYRCDRRAWRLFEEHHYLSAAINPWARCYAATWEDRPVAFCAVLPLVGYRRRWRISRLVTLPDCQGLGIGSAVLEAVGEVYAADDQRLNLTTSHPAMIAHCAHSARWRAVRPRRNKNDAADQRFRDYRGAGGRAVTSFEYVPAHAIPDL